MFFEENINIKATSKEGLGFIEIRKEMVACAVCLLKK